VTDTVEKKPRKRTKKEAASAEERPPAAAPLPVVVTVAEYQPLVVELAELKHQLAGVAYDLTDKRQEAAARADRRRCVTLRSQIQELHSQLKRPIIDRGRALDADLKRVTAAILEVETPIDQQILAHEAERERKAEERRRAEEAKAAAVRAEIVRAFSVPRTAGQRLTAAEWKGWIAHFEAETVSAERFPDFTVEAQEAKCAALEWCAAALTEAERYESEQADLARQRAELAAEAARQREARKAEEAQRAAEEAARRKRLADEEAELAQKRAAFIAEQQAAEARAQREREQAEARARELEERARREREEADAQARREREQAEAQEQRRREEVEARSAAEREAMARAQQHWFRYGPPLLAALEQIVSEVEMPGRLMDLANDAIRDARTKF
jgi:hypothetical protein